MSCNVVCFTEKSLRNIFWQEEQSELLFHTAQKTKEGHVQYLVRTGFPGLIQAGIWVLIINKNGTLRKQFFSPDRVMYESLEMSAIPKYAGKVIVNINFDLNDLET